MSILSISYDLYKEAGRGYEELIEAIKGFAWCHVTESTWFVETTLSPKEMYEHLDPHLHAKDKVIITPVPPGSWWSQGLSKEVCDWLHEKLKTKRSA